MKAPVLFCLLSLFAASPVLAREVGSAEKVELMKQAANEGLAKAKAECEFCGEEELSRRGKEYGDQIYNQRLAALENEPEAKVYGVAPIVHKETLGINYNTASGGGVKFGADVVGGPDQLGKLKDPRFGANINGVLGSTKGDSGVPQLEVAPKIEWNPQLFNKQHKFIGSMSFGKNKNLGQDFTGKGSFGLEVSGENEIGEGSIEAGADVGMQTTNSKTYGFLGLHAKIAGIICPIKLDGDTGICFYGNLKGAQALASGPESLASVDADAGVSLKRKFNAKPTEAGIHSLEVRAGAGIQAQKDPAGSHVAGDVAGLSVVLK